MNNYGIKHWIMYNGERLSLPEACRQANIAYQKVVAKSAYRGIPMQMAFDTYIVERDKKRIARSGALHKLPVKPYVKFGEDRVQPSANPKDRKT